jgi:hypothetical protein
MLHGFTSATKALLLVELYYQVSIVQAPIGCIYAISAQNAELTFAHLKPEIVMEYLGPSHAVCLSTCRHRVRIFVTSVIASLSK